jgi:hypothetical protein
MIGLSAMLHSLMADTASAETVMTGFVTPVVRGMGALAALASVFFLISGGFGYMTSSGQPERLDHAKRVIRNALIGLVVVLGAGVLTAILSHAYGTPGGATVHQLPTLNAIQPNQVSNGLVAVIIKAVTGLLNNIVQQIAAPFLQALSYFTSGTPLIADNPGVFNLWLTVVGIADATFVLVVALLGFHVMSASTFGLDEIEFKHLLPQLGLIFLLVNCSVFVIDGIIELSNALIHALQAGYAPTSVWDVLTAITKQADSFGVAALLIMMAFLILAVVLLIYYIGRIVILYLGAILAPLVLLIWLIPGFRDFSESAGKTYLATIFALFVQVLILDLAATLFDGMSTGPTHTPDPLMAMMVGIATLLAMLKTQGLMMQLSYVSAGPRTARKLGTQFMTGISYLGSKGRTAATMVSSRNTSTSPSSTSGTSKRPSATGTTYVAPKTKDAGNTSGQRTGHTNTQTKARVPTGTTTPAPKPTEPKPPKPKEKS